MNLKLNETFCVNNWCRKVYDKQFDNMFGMCPECNQKEFEEALSGQKRKDRITEEKVGIRKKITEKQHQKVLEVMKLLKADKKSILISAVTKYLCQYGGFPRTVKSNNNLAIINDSVIRNIMKKLEIKGKVKAIKKGKSTHYTWLLLI